MPVSNPQRRNKNLFIPWLYSISALNIILQPIIASWNGMVDELVVLFLFLIGYRSLRFNKNKEFYMVVGILLMFFIYSLMYGANGYNAVFLDFIQWMKPFVSFFIPLYVPFRISEGQRAMFRNIFCLCGVFCVVQMPFIEDIYSNTTNYYPCCILCAVSYMLFSDFNKKDWCLALLMLTPGLASIRAKFFTEYVFIIFVVFFLKTRIKITVKWLLVIGFLGTISVYISWEKFSMYFVTGGETGAARTMMYLTVPSIIEDYFPLGPGLGTFNTDAAAKFYSPLYVKYGLNRIFGLGETDYHAEFDFLHDTFYPCLAQFGIMGFLLYVWFWARRWKESLFLSFERYKLFIFVFFVVFVENIASNGFTGTSGVSYMMILGIILTQNIKKHIITKK